MFYVKFLTFRYNIYAILFIKQKFNISYALPCIKKYNNNL